MFTSSGGYFNVKIPQAKKLDDGHASLKHGEIYSIEITNNYGDDAEISVQIDGKSVGTFRSHPGKMEIKGPINENKNFTFYNTNTKEGKNCQEKSIRDDEKGWLFCNFVPKVFIMNATFQDQTQQINCRRAITVGAFKDIFMDFFNRFKFLTLDMYSDREHRHKLNDTNRIDTIDEIFVPLINKIKLFVLFQGINRESMTFVNFDENMKFSDFRRLIADFYCLDINDFELYDNDDNNNKIIEKTQTIRETLHSPNSANLSLKILNREIYCVRTMNLVGKATYFFVTKNTKVEELKNKLCYNDKVEVSAQRLIYAGHQLENEKTLWEYNISDSTTIILVLRMRGGTGIQKGVTGLTGVSDQNYQEDQEINVDYSLREYVSIKLVPNEFTVEEIPKPIPLKDINQN